MQFQRLPLGLAVTGAMLATTSLVAQAPGSPAASEQGAAAVYDPFRPTPQLEKRSYIKDMKVLAHHFRGEERGGKMQMMAIGDRRYLIHEARIYDITDPLKPVLMSEGAWHGSHQIQVAYSESTAKWLAMVPDNGTSAQPGVAKAVRGPAIFDISDPRKPAYLAHFPSNSGTHRNYYDGGRYAYLAGSPGPEHYTDRKWMWGGSAGGLQIIDMADPAKPKLVSAVSYPGQRVGEVEARKAWSAANDRAAMPTMHGPAYVPLRVEDGGKLAYSPWGALGFMIHDVSDPARPKLVSRWEPQQYISGMGGLQFHTIDVARLNRGFVITNPEAFWPQCRAPYHDSYVLDVSDPKNPRQLAVMPVPLPPPDAPYKTFCDRYGRFGPHNPPHLKAPGKPAANFTCYSFFGAGLHCYDISDPRNPKHSAYFIPEQGGEHGKWEPLGGPMSESIRTVDNVFIEWDRKLIWAATDTGLYVLSATALGEPVLGAMPVREWALPSINKGFERFRTRP